MDMVVYGESYNRAMQGIEDMLFQIENPMINFKRAAYTEGFQTYMQTYAGVMADMEQVYQMEENPKTWCRKLAEHLTDKAEKRLADIPKKGKRADQLLSYNMVLATYLFPALLETKAAGAEDIVDAIIEVWNQRFKTTVGKATYEKIEAGFQKKYCYITTAVCESLGKEDDCYELNLLRNYRDTYLMSTKEGKALVEEYYNVAPTIVTRINKEKNAAELYQDIWNTYLKPCIQYIEGHQEEACKEWYMEMVLKLKGRYIA